MFEALFGGSPERQGTLAALAQIAQASGPQRMPQSLYSILGGGLMAGQQATQQARERAAREQFQALELEDAQMGLQDRRQARDRQQQIGAALQGANDGNGFNPDAAYQALARIDPAYALEFRRKYGPAPVEYDTKLEAVRGADGKDLLVQLSKTAPPRVLEGMSPREKLHFLNTGGQTVGVGEFSGAKSAAFNNTADPGALLAAATARRGQDITMRGQNMTDARAREEFALKQQIGKAPTEFQGKSAAFGLRATEADKILNKLEKDGVTDTGVIRGVVQGTAEMTPFLGDKLGAATSSAFNVLPEWAGGLSSQQQRVEQARRDFVNAVLRQESGAAIGASEFDNASRQYFPQIGDSEAVIKQKARNRQLAIQGLQTNAGRAAMTAPSADGWGIRKVD